MECHIRVVEEEDWKEAQNIQIQQRFTILQQDWNDYKSRTQRPKHSRPEVNPPLLHNSPGNLMSSPATLSSSSTIWKVRTNELAIEEIRMERKAAIESGKLKGRRLSYDDIDMGFDVKGDIFTRNDWSQEGDDQVIPSSDEEYGESSEGKEVPVCLRCLSYSSASSSSSAASSIRGKNMEENYMAVKEEEKVASTVCGKIRKVENGSTSKIGKYWEFGREWVAFISAIVVIFTVGSLGLGAYNADEEGPRIHLVPT